jgi:hypothetical protein
VNDNSLKNAVLTLAVFTLAGPLIGYLVLTGAVAILTSKDLAEALKTALGLLVMLPIAGLFAIMLAGVPATVTGAFVAALDYNGSVRLYRTPIAIVTGALAGFVTIWTFAPADIGSMLAYTSVAAISAAACARLTRRGAPG